MPGAFTNRIFKSIFFACLICCFSVVKAQIEWQKLGGPYGGNVIAFAKDAKGNYYAARNDGLYISDDKCLSWNKINTPPATILSLAVTPQAEIFIGTNNGLYFSSNAGEKWMFNEISEESKTAVTNIGVNSLGYIFANNFRSTNNGASFYELDLEAIVNCYAFSAYAIYAGTNKGIFKSGDNGNNWEAANTGIENENIISITIAKNRLVALSQNNGIFYSDDSGETWQLPEKNIGTKNITAIHAGQDNFIHAVTKDSGAYRSDDDGLNWQNIGKSGDEFNTVFASINDPLVIMGSATNGVLRSMMNGKYWSESSIGMQLTDIKELAPGKVRLFAVADNNIYSIYYSTEKWVNSTQGLPKSIYYRIASGENIVALAGGNPHNNENAAVFILDESNNTWNKTAELPGQLKAYTFLETNKRGDIILGGGNSTQMANAIIVKMKDSAQWELVFWDSTVFINKILLADDGNIYVHLQDFGLSNKVIFSTDGGKNWQKYDMAALAGFKLLAMNAKGTVFGKNYNDVYWHDKAAGDWKIAINKAWKNADSAMVLFDEANNLFFLKQDLSVVNATGTLVNSPDNDFYFLKDAVIGADEKLYAITYKGIYATSSNLKTGFNENESIFQHVNIWPNPATDHLNISVNAKSAQKVIAYIYDVNGKEIEQITPINLFAGANNFSININGLPTGMYILKLRTNSEINTYKFIISSLR